ncbi:VOC family protein [Bacillus sp. FJAT-49732]|uniref:VOC family protein n=1 Tax=Lederbergia citrisecunda TaxID=2833583 RepID=A0A942TSH9_9BACI|nr:VOC family protein [Lederbergia citrisecunda]MBS4201367.1 VOC family protein [Lederbergia citrisecunda]
MTISLNLVVIKSKNLEESVAFYKELGLQFQKEQHGNGPEHYACELDNLVFEIYPATQHHNEKIRIGFSIEHMENVIASFKSRGTEIVTEPTVSPWGERAVVKDPDGNSVELLEKEG